MILAIDCGNTRAKWGRFDGTRFDLVGATAIGALDQLEQALAAMPQPTRIVISNVAAVAVRARIEHATARFNVPILWITAQSAAAGVLNRYEDPGALGTDRWASLIGARQRCDGACVVVNCGTATTVDRLTAAGEFVGGFILPSIALMKRALSDNTARLPLAEGRYSTEPRRTVDAIESGCIEATVGAIERARERAGSASRLFVTGGASAIILSTLRAPVEHVEHLTLEGLVRLAQ
jgi:type III pantothenate kinase